METISKELASGSKWGYGAEWKRLRGDYSVEIIPVKVKCAAGGSYQGYAVRVTSAPGGGVFEHDSRYGFSNTPSSRAEAESLAEIYIHSEIERRVEQIRKEGKK